MSQPNLGALRAVADRLDSLGLEDFVTVIDGREGIVGDVDRATSPLSVTGNIPWRNAWSSPKLRCAPA